jgi:hypothetical protein
VREAIGIFDGAVADEEDVVAALAGLLMVKLAPVVNVAMNRLGQYKRKVRRPHRKPFRSRAPTPPRVPRGH